MQNHRSNRRTTRKTNTIRYYPCDDVTFLCRDLHPSTDESRPKAKEGQAVTVVTVHNVPWVYRSISMVSDINRVVPCREEVRVRVRRDYVTLMTKPTMSPIMSSSYSSYSSYSSIKTIIGS